MAPSKFLRNMRIEARTCAEHGEFQAAMTPIKTWTGCPTCMDIENKRMTAEAIDAIAREWKGIQAKQMLGRAAIPPRFADRHLSSYVPQCDQAKHALEIAQGYADNFEQMLANGSGLILCGGVGTGKTHLAVGIAHEIMVHGRSTIFTSVMGAVRAVKETYSRGAEMSEREVIRSFVAPELLILDEVGVQFGSNTEKLILFEIINGRYEEMKPTIVISNLAKDALATFLGERSFDRLREGGGRLVAFDWPSYRTKA